MEVDFGCHRGIFLLGMAELYPEKRFLGIERQALRVARCLSKIQRHSLTNAHAVRGEGSEALQRWLPTASVQVLHLSFPDPWPKRRHASRRLVNEDFLAEVHRILKPGGVLRIMTDDAPYFSEIVKLLGEGWQPREWNDGVIRPQTSFQKHFASLGQQPHCCAVSRRS